VQYVFSLTGADFSRGTLVAIPVRRAGKRKNAIHYHTRSRAASSGRSGPFKRTLATKG